MGQRSEVTKVVFTADLHFYYKNFPGRLEDYRRSWGYLVDYAIDNAQAVVIAGDLLRSHRSARIDELVVLIEGLKKLVSAGLEVIAIRGNHDPPDLGDLLKEAVPGVRYFSSPARLELGRVVFSLVPWWEGQKPQDVVDAAEGLGGDILALHTTLEGAVASSGFVFEEAVPLESMCAYKMVVSGHIHKFQVLKESPFIFYPGSLEPADFGEAGDEKGFVVVDLDDMSWEFVRVPHAELMVARASADQLDGIFNSAGGKVVRLVLSGTAGQLAELDREAIAKLAAEAGVRHLDVQYEVAQAEFAASEINAQFFSLSPTELLKLYLEKEGVNDEDVFAEGCSIIEHVF